MRGELLLVVPRPGNAVAVVIEGNRDRAQLRSRDDRAHRARRRVARRFELEAVERAARTLVAATSTTA